MDNSEFQAIEDVVEHLNMRTLSHFRSNTSTTTRPILARLHEGFTAKDMIDVIDTMTGKWIGNDTMERYLRPSTLFGTKFEGYLQEARRRSRPSQPSQGGKSGFRKGLLDDE